MFSSDDSKKIQAFAKFKYNNKQKQSEKHIISYSLTKNVKN